MTKRQIAFGVICFLVGVLVGMEVGGVSLNDPAFDSAPQKVSLAGFHQAWAANAFLAAFIRPRR